jgi:serine/threonine-protein kinase
MLASPASRERRGGKSHDGPVPLANVQLWLAGVAEALDFVHSRGFVHRDVKPAYILFDDHGTTYLGDFGIVRTLASGPKTSHLTATGMLVGTPEYMAPELISGNEYDGRVDQYALAVIVFELLAGRTPFQENTSFGYLVAHASKMPPPLRDVAPGVTPATSLAVERALRKAFLKRAARTSEDLRAGVDLYDQNEFSQSIAALTRVVEAERGSARVDVHRERERLAWTQGSFGLEEHEGAVVRELHCLPCGVDAEEVRDTVHHGDPG